MVRSICHHSHKRQRRFAIAAVLEGTSIKIHDFRRHRSRITLHLCQTLEKHRRQRLDHQFPNQRRFYQRMGATQIHGGTGGAKPCVHDHSAFQHPG